MPRTSSLRAPDLIEFFEGTGTDDQGRSLSQILAWSDENLEWSHDYIQTVFPLPERSDFQYTVAVIDERVFDSFRARKDLRESLRTAFKRILSFYGFELSESESGDPVVKKGANYKTNPKVWNRRMDHNHLRITRILRSLRILGLEAEALAWTNTLLPLADHASESSKGFWRRAAQRSLNIPPDDMRSKDDDRTVGKPFLIKYEENRTNNTPAADGGNGAEAKPGGEEKSKHTITQDADGGLEDNRPVKRSRPT
ncbi:hypothetical protein GLAREA_05193 [Glarea lozoyensis ATCC 20868]|uniref:Opioid growth factor receptor (OGFr) conserved domain-containing protein n=1 Tax=Glarea lozoyensis (strain ATCC 20868 / MF5171) TaxID=1116229 RepID=S3DDQ0_GLAL2|nr:uncharacterized protein GLAREA_05193 [Glarea lozoyensis ATCC 20868]EPE35855.1 hypothetical protein GLAREA_05193 [Glarea lozoyensis ATCC 20868]